MLIIDSILMLRCACPSSYSNWSFDWMLIYIGLDRSWNVTCGTKVLSLSTIYLQGLRAKYRARHLANTYDPVRSCLCNLIGARLPVFIQKLNHVFLSLFWQARCGNNEHGVLRLLPLCLQSFQYKIAQKEKKRKMARYFENTATFNFSWDQVASGYWKRYPNPQR